VSGVNGRGTLTLLTQLTAPTVSQASRIHHTQGTIRLESRLFGIKGMIGRTTQRAVGLEGKV
jgi:hypothetical protein